MFKFSSGKPSAKFIHAVKIITDLLNEEGLRNVCSVFAEATEHAIKEYFSKRFGVTFHDNHGCIHRLISNRCPGRNSEAHLEIPGSDHESSWKKDGKHHMIVLQSYYLEYKMLKKLVEFCEKHRLEAVINAETSWHFPGQTFNVIIKKTENQDS